MLLHFLEKMLTEAHALVRFITPYLLQFPYILCTTPSKHEALSCTSENTLVFKELALKMEQNKTVISCKLRNL